jgi:glycosyltransferase involved in cell wall biosynthesis
MPHNGGYCAALEAAMQHVRSPYFMFWPDDDWMFPDHVARLVHALETTGASVSHTQTLTCYFLGVPDGSWKVRAYKVLHERPNDPIETLTGPTMTFCNMLFRRTLLDEIGFLDPDLSLADFEYTLRASQRYDFIAVDAVTSQWNYNVEGKSFQHQMGLDRMAREQRAIYARYPSDLKYVADRRAAWDAQVTSNANTVLWPPDQYLPEDYEDDGRP